MTEPTPQPEQPVDDPEDDTNGDSPPQDKGDPIGSPESPSDRGNAEDLEYGPTVINNFYADATAQNIGVSGSAGPLGKPVIRRESGTLPTAEVSEALRFYLEPDLFSQALKILTRRRLVALTGPEGCGKKAGTLELARQVCPKAEFYTVLPPTRTLQQLATSKSYREGQTYLLHDWTPIATDARSVASYDLGQLRNRLHEAKAYMAITFESASQLQALLGDMCLQWSAPEPAALLDRCISRLPDLKLEENQLEQLRLRAKEIRSPRLIVKLAESARDGVDAAIAEASETENSAVAAWFSSKPARWMVWSVTALSFLSGIGERKFERQLTLLTDINKASNNWSAGKETQDQDHYQPDENQEFPQSRWALANDAALETFISVRDAAAPVGSEHRPAFRTKQFRLHFMTELNVRFGDELWASVRDWLYIIADQPFGEAQIAAGYGLALLSRCALQEVQATYLTPWSAGNLKNRLMAVNVLWAMAEDDLCAPAALRIAVSWVWNHGQERAITAAIAFGGPLGQRYPDEAMRWLWALSLRGERIGRVARTAMSQLFAMESENDIGKSVVIRFILRKIRKILESAEADPGKRLDSTRGRRAALAVANAVLGTIQTGSDVPVVVNVIRTRPADVRPIGKLWAATLNSAPHRRAAIRALHSALAGLADDNNSVELANKLGRAIMPELTPRAIGILEFSLPNPDLAEKISESVVAAFLGVQR